MRQFTFILSLFLCMAMVPLSSASAREQRFSTSPADGFADLAERLLPSVVNISSTQKAVDVQDFPEMPHFPPGSPFEEFFEEFMGRRGHDMPAIPPASLGSGF